MKLTVKSGSITKSVSQPSIPNCLNKGLIDAKTRPGTWTASSWHCRVTSQCIVLPIICCIAVNKWEVCCSDVYLQVIMAPYGNGSATADFRSETEIQHAADLALGMVSVKFSSTFPLLILEYPLSFWPKKIEREKKSYGGQCFSLMCLFRLSFRV